MLAPCRLGGGGLLAHEVLTFARGWRLRFPTSLLLTHSQHSEFQLSLKLTGTYFVSDSFFHIRWS